MPSLKKNQTVKLACHRYIIKQILGEGTYGIVYKAINIATKQEVAIKYAKSTAEIMGCDMSGVQDEACPATVLREVSLLKALDHPNVVKLLYFINSKKDNSQYFIFEYCSYDLQSYLKKFKKSISARDIKKITYQILQGTSYLHSKAVLHRDLKPQNILMTKVGQVKLADFGLSRNFSLPFKNLTEQCLTQIYRAPEVILGHISYGINVDIWPIGCILYELSSAGKLLFYGDSSWGQLIEIFKKMGTPTEKTWKGLTKLKHYQDDIPKFDGTGLKELCKGILCEDGVDLLERMLILDPLKRISAKQAMEHSYFKELFHKKK